MSEDNRNQEYKRIKDTYIRLFNTDDGKVVLKDMLSYGAPDISPFAVDPYETAFNCGKQDFTLKLLKMLKEEDN